MREFKKLTKEEWGKLSLAVLREIGRQSGVKSPCSLKKEQLIQDIMDIQAGTLCPFLSNGVGAPPKSSIDVSEYYLVADDYSSLENENVGYTFNDVSEDDSLIIEGVLEQTYTGYVF
ncbi:MAG: hypothetical protein J6R83_00410, partial [Clostridia bacterium]|nr:hypothetical protein [Clostridia bacterium]